MDVREGPIWQGCDELGGLNPRGKETKEKKKGK